MPDSHREKAKAAFRENEQHFRLLAENATDIIWMMDLDLNWQYISPVVELILGFTAEEARKLSVEEILSPKSAALARQLVSRRLEEVSKNTTEAAKPVIVELEQICKDGSFIPVEIHARFMRDEDGMPNGIIGITRDIRERKRIEKELERYRAQLEDAVRQRTADLAETNRRLHQEVTERKHAEERAEKANRAKSQFLANMSHELRTPLHGILSFANFGSSKAEIADRGTLKEYFEQIQKSGSSLLAMVNDLLDLSKLESGRSTLQLEDVDLYTLVLGLMEEMRFLARRRDITVVCHEPERSVSALVDRLKITQVMRNLLGNALKFSPRGGRVEVTIEKQETTILVRVHDQGPGIPEEEMETIFDKFVQSSKTRSGAGGTGLGLAICRETLTLHGGQIWAENAPDGGAVLSFELPMTIPNAVPDTEEEKPVAPAIALPAMEPPVIVSMMNAYPLQG